MMFWLIAVPSAAALFALVWWSSGRAKRDLRRRSINTEIGIQQGKVVPYDHRSDSGAGGGFGGF